MMKWTDFRVSAAVAWALFATMASAEETTSSFRDAGHSFHGEVFNEGPRQAAELLPGVGDVRFPVSTKSELCQQFFNQGIAQLHGFWHFESERSFRQAASHDPECAMAYWGMAMSNMENPKRAQGFIKQAAARKASASRLEQLYIDALEEFLASDATAEDGEKKRRQKLIGRYEEILHEFPGDLETRAFLALAIYESKGKGIPISSYFAVDALLKDILEESPLHPCHHYRIHLWDYEKPELALDSAARCGAAAPAIAHMWHMPGHIYSRLKRYEDAVWQQSASARVDHAHMMRFGVLPDQIHNFAHNNEWLIRNLIHLGDAPAALDLARNMISLPRHPKWNTYEKQGSAHFGRLRLAEALVAFEMWDELLVLAETPVFEPTDRLEQQLHWKRAVGAARFLSGDVLGGCDLLQELRHTRQQRQSEQRQAGVLAGEAAAAKQVSEEDRKRALEEAEKKFQSDLQQIANAIHELEGHLHLAADAPADAVAAFKKVDKLLNPIWLWESQLRSGNFDDPLQSATKAVETDSGETIPLARLARLQWKAGQQEKALNTFSELRKISSRVALDAPVFQQLRPIAEASALARDWRLPHPPAPDFGERPPLESLGPLVWRPSPAADWSLMDRDARFHSLADFRGREVIVVFYLGSGCLHCAQQLQALAPLADEFQKAGISLIAVSTDNPKALQESHENYLDGEFPFPLVANPDLSVFKQYRCFDDFEQQPLHGTFLIDAQGKTRWQDIGHEPFMQLEFLLQESRRLLALPELQSVSEPQREAVRPVQQSDVR